MNFKLRKFLNKESSAGVVFCMPFIIGFLVFLIIPMGMSLYYSFCDYDILSPPVFTGLDNYIEIFTADETFWHSVKATFLFAFVSVPLRLIFALIVALILVKSTKATGFYRAAYYLPSILGGSVAVAVLWRRIFATEWGAEQYFGNVWIGYTVCLAGKYKDCNLDFGLIGNLAVWLFYVDFFVGIKTDTTGFI